MQTVQGRRVAGSWEVSCIALGAGIAFGALTSLTAFALARYGPTGGDWSFRGNGALAAYSVFGSGADQLVSPIVVAALVVWSAVAPALAMRFPRADPAVRKPIAPYIGAACSWTSCAIMSSPPVAGS